MDQATIEELERGEKMKREEEFEEFLAEEFDYNEDWILEVFAKRTTIWRMVWRISKAKIVATTVATPLRGEKYKEE